MTLLFILVVVPILMVAIVAINDLTQRKHAITRNFPVIWRFRYWLEELGQPLRQYLFAGDRDERPYNRVPRSWVYASAKGQNNLIGFGSQAGHRRCPLGAHEMFRSALCVNSFNSMIAIVVWKLRSGLAAAERIALRR